MTPQSHPNPSPPPKPPAPSAGLWVALNSQQSQQIVGGYWAYHLAAAPSVRPTVQSAGYHYGYYGVSSADG